MRINHIIKLLFTYLLLTINSYALATIPNDLKPGWESIQINSLRNDVYQLAGNTMQGRQSLTAGDDKAIQMIAERFKKLGLKPIANDSYLQAIPLVEFQPNLKQNYLSVIINQKNKRWQQPQFFIEFPKDINLSSDIIFVGYGITAPELNYDDYQGIDVNNKIVLLFEHEPQETDAKSIFNGNANTVYTATRLKILNAQRHGAIAVLIAPEPNRHHPSNQQRRARIYAQSKRPPLPAQMIQDDEVKIPAALISDAIAKNIAGSPKLLGQLQSSIDQQLKPQSRKLPASVTLHNQNEWVKTGTSYNVAGLLEGNDEQLKNETIIVSAHHDHDGQFGKSIWYGADDNASGTTGVMNLAQAMVDNNTVVSGLKIKRSILFVVFAAEERGLLGSFYMINHPLRPLATTKAVLNFDMIGRNEKPSSQTKGLITIPADTNNRLNLIGSHYSPSYQQLIEKQNQYVGLNLDNRFDEEHVLNVFFRSDQLPFVLNNIPSFWWFTGFHPDYHQVTDTADKINYAKMQKILRLAYLTLYRFADGETPIFVVSPGLN